MSRTFSSSILFGTKILYLSIHSRYLTKQTFEHVVYICGPMSYEGDNNEQLIVYIPDNECAYLIATILEADKKTTVQKIFVQLLH